MGRYVLTPTSPDFIRTHSHTDKRALGHALPMAITYHPSQFVWLTSSTRLRPYESTARIGVGGVEECIAPPARSRSARVR